MFEFRRINIWHFHYTGVLFHSFFRFRQARLLSFNIHFYAISLSSIHMKNKYRCFLLSSFNSFNSWRNAQCLHVKLTDDVSHSWFDAMHSPFTIMTATVIECTDWKEFKKFMYGSKAPRLATKKKLQLYQNIYHIFVHIHLSIGLQTVLSFFCVCWSHVLSIASCLVIHSQYSNISPSLWHFYFYTKWRCQYFWDFFSPFAYPTNCQALEIEK